MYRSVLLLLPFDIALLYWYAAISRLDTSRCNRHRLMATVLHFLAVHAGRRTRIVDASAYLVASLDVHIFDVESVDVAREVAQDREEQINEEVGAASCYKEDSEGWNCRLLVGILSRRGKLGLTEYCD
jgi:hypothetical protein